MATIPLVSHSSSQSILAYRAGAAIDVGSYLADVAHTASRLPAGEHVLNTCVDRYRFAVGLAAALVTRRISLLPPTYTPATIRDLLRFAPDVFCLTDDDACDIDLPRCRYSENSQRARAPFEIPAVDADQIAAYVFTSGSTGAPMPHRKRWGQLVSCVRIEAERIGLNDGRAHTLVGTVAPQHMYGFESSLLVALQSGNAFAAERPFYPQDIAAALAAVPRPRALISTPIHLRALLTAGVTLPPIDLVLSATAPLTRSLAAQMEQAVAAPLLEIYGCTETGQIATRHTTATAEWQLWPEVTLSVRAGAPWAQGGHLEQATQLNDVLTLLPGNRFLLEGRTADLVHIAGKRSSLAHLNQQLLSVPGVVDGVFFLPQAGRATARDFTRLTALVVAPGLDSSAVTRALRERIDPAFLPRPLLLVDHLPRNSTGKLPLAALETLAALCLQRGAACAKAQP